MQNKNSISIQLITLDYHQ